MMNEHDYYNDEEPHYLLDSNIVSELIKCNASFNVIKKIAEHNSDCAICSPTLHELLYGYEKMADGAKKTFLGDYINADVLENFKVKIYSEKSSRIHAKIRADAERIGTPVPFSDSMIAAIALANHMVLVTRNKKHFEAIQQVSGLEIENWFE
ncbi:MAG: type II toxin-antitoxin system VapC family toxin [Treponema sp.]|nr:type II toxin-antitoxin system VapC family toxin [Treponema sp.]